MPRPLPIAAQLAAITGWQEHRRRAMALLKAQSEQARRSCDWMRLDALAFCRHDVDERLREAAAHTIEESCRMSCAHEAWPQQVAA